MKSLEDAYRGENRRQVKIDLSHEPCEPWDREKDCEDLWKGDAVSSTETLEDAFTQSHDGNYKMHYLEKK